MRPVIRLAESARLARRPRLTRLPVAFFTRISCANKNGHFLKGLFWRLSVREAGEAGLGMGGAEGEGEQGSRFASPPVASPKRFICAAARLAENRDRPWSAHAPLCPAPRSAGSGSGSCWEPRGCFRWQRRPCHTQTHGRRSSPAAGCSHVGAQSGCLSRTPSLTPAEALRLGRSELGGAQSAERSRSPRARPRPQLEVLDAQDLSVLLP